MPTRLLLAVVLACLAAGGALALAAVLPGGEAAPRAHLALDAATPLFGRHNAANLRPGERRSACATVSNAGDAAGRAALYLRTLHGDLARYLTLTVTRGMSGCEPFAPDRRTFAPELGPGVVYHGALADFPADRAGAIVDPDLWAPGHATSYRFELTLGDDPAAAGRSASWDWRLAVDSVPAPPPTAAAASPSATSHAASSSTAPGCGRLQLAGGVRGRAGRTLSRTVRVSERVRAVLVLRVHGSRGAPRVDMTAGLRVRGRKTLLIPGWARVRYRINGARETASTVRPFRSRAAAGRFHLGVNRISIAVQRRRGGPKRLAAFRISASQLAVSGGRRVCVLSA